jgi:hypothetical protein
LFENFEITSLEDHTSMPNEIVEAEIIFENAINSHN